MKKALILLGCPESPSQTPMAVYVTHKFKQMGYEVTTASTPSAMKLLEVGDPEGYYIENKIDIDSCINELEDGMFDVLVGFIHKDAAVSYFVTFNSILNTPSIAIIFEKDMEKLEDFQNMVAESTNATIVSARAYHNPTPLRVRFDKAVKKLNESGKI
ncbi:DUF1890 domain-containing protein [Methanobacterium sp. ACI-7]|uniref:DUF1890 domain-containing protein n=1 Tax=unclassified Methanobacterium TaxID=2627676 RepID=UPI0039C21907